MDIEYIKQRFNSLDEKLQGLLEINNRLILENIKLNKIITSIPKVAEPPREPREVDTATQPIIMSFDNIPKETTGRSDKKGLEIHFHIDNSVKVIGNTYLHKTILKENGGVWDRTVGGWVFSDTHLDQLVNALTEKEIEFKNNCVDLAPSDGKIAFQFMED